MKMMCWNINGVATTAQNAALKYGSWKGFFDAFELDILCLQEAKIPEEKLTKQLCCVEGYQSFWACSRSKRGYSGVTTYCSAKWAPYECKLDTLTMVPEQNKGASDDGNHEGRFLLCDFGEESFVLINVYVPNAGTPPERPRLGYKLSFLRALLTKVNLLLDAGRKVMVVGDFNVATKPVDIHPRIGLEKTYSLEERELFDSFIEGPNAPLVDVWRHFHPQQRDTYTVFDEKTSARSFNEGVRIDYVLASKNLLPTISRCDILGGADCLPPKWSDHAGIILEMDAELTMPPSIHPPCAAWTTLNTRFNDPKQRSIATMFKKSFFQTRSDVDPGQGPKESAKRKRDET